MVYPGSIVADYYIDNIARGAVSSTYVRATYIGDMQQGTRRVVVELKSCPVGTTFVKFTFDGTVPEWAVKSDTYCESKMWGSGDTGSGTLTVHAWYKTSTPPAEYTITLSSLPNGAGQLFGAGTYPEGVTCLITERPISNSYEFQGWYENGALVFPDSTNQFVVSRNRALVAHYRAYTGLILKDQNTGIILKKDTNGMILRDA